MFNRSELFQKIEEMASVHTDGRRRVDLHAVEEDMARFLNENRYAIDVDRLAIDLVSAYDRSKRPNLQNKQLSLFEPDAWIPRGKKQRVQMKYAQREDFLSWAGLEITECSASVNAHARKMTYINSRLSVWDAGCKTLAELEASKFEEAETP